MFKSIRWLAMLLATVLLLAACAGGDDDVAAPETDAPTEQEEPGAEETPEEPAEPTPDDDHGFQDGDRLTLVLGSPPGGGFDTQARLLAPYLEDAFEEVAGLDITVVVENREGGRHRVANEYVYTAPPDGKTLFHTSLQLAVGNQLLQNANYDLQEMTPIASAGNSQRAIAVRRDLELPEETILGLAAASEEQPILFNHPGLDADVALLQALLEDGGVTFNFDPVPAQTAEGMASMLRGEVDAMFTTTAGMAPFVEDNPEDLMFLVNMGCEREEAFPDVETVVEQGAPNAQELCAAIGGDDRPFLGPPGVPPATVALLEDALLHAMENPDYQEQAQQAGLPTSPIGAEAVAQLIDAVLAVYEDYIDRLPTE